MAKKAKPKPRLKFSEKLDPMPTPGQRLAKQVANNIIDTNTAMGQGLDKKMHEAYQDAVVFGESRIILERDDLSPGVQTINWEKQFAMVNQAYNQERDKLAQKYLEIERLKAEIEGLKAAVKIQAEALASVRPS